MIIVAIDPGMNGSGVAIYNTDLKMFTNLVKLDLWELYSFMKSYKDDKYLIENSNLDKSNWHGATARENVGKNKAVSQLIVNYAEHLGLDYTELKPDGYSKVYTDKDGCYPDFYKQVFRKDTGWEDSSNKDSRAAAAMILRNKKWK